MFKDRSHVQLLQSFTQVENSVTFLGLATRGIRCIEHSGSNLFDLA